MAFSEFIYNNPNGPGYCQISIESIYPRIIIIRQTNISLIQNVVDYSFVDRIFLSPDCREITNDTLIAHICNLTKNNNCYAKFFSISPEYNEDNGEYIKVFHLITLNTIEETRIQRNDNIPKRYGQFNKQWIKTRRALGIKAILRRMTDLRKKNFLVHCATNNWMIIVGDGKERGHRMITEKLIELDQLVILASHMTKNEASMFMKKTKKYNEGWITIGKKM